ASAGARRLTELSSAVLATSPAASDQRGTPRQRRVGPSRHSGRSELATRAPVSSPGRRSAIVAPLRRLGQVISRVPGFSVFGGPLGWVFTGLLLLGAAMIVASVGLGRRRPGRASARPV
ncbi:MAG TPA: hypothetical protein VKB75_13385, partial [Jatrophihabitans sp.]|nr:hypothetical protein [Jatrophihabitans sp.]